MGKLASTVADSTGINTGRGQGVYQGNIDGETMIFRTLVSSPNVQVVSGSQDIILSGTDGGASGSLQPALFSGRLSWMSAEGFNTVTSSFNFISFTNKYKN